MKNTRTCPKCGCGEVLRIKGDSRAYGAGNNIQVGLTIFSAVLVNRYVCCRCGYTEEWINQEDIKTLKDKFE